MIQYIDKAAVVAEIERRLKANGAFDEMGDAAWWEDKGMCDVYKSILSFVDTLEVIDPYITCVQYTNREAAIKAHAEDYSWNIESELFQQLTPEQQKLWRKEIEQACISGGYSGLNLAKDPRYKENLEVKEVDLEEEVCAYMDNEMKFLSDEVGYDTLSTIARHFFELGLKAQKGGEK